MKPITLSASILSADFSRLGEQIHSTEKAGVDWIHIDVMDGHFVPNISMGPFIVETCRKLTMLPLDTHLMISNPQDHIEAFAHAGANWITIHIENNPNVHRTLQRIRDMGCHPGIALNPGTPAHSIDAVLDAVDMVLVMTVNPGFSGQKFISSTMNKVSQIARQIADRQLAAQIQVDGGLTAETLPQAYDAGARIIVAATSIFRHTNGIAAGVQTLRQAAGAHPLTEKGI